MDIRYWLRNFLIVGALLGVITLINSVRPFAASESGIFEVGSIVVLAAMLLAWGALALRPLTVAHVQSNALHAFAAVFAAVSFAGIGRETTWGAVYGVSRTTELMLTNISIVIFAAMLLYGLALWVMCTSGRLASARVFFRSRSWGWIAFGLVVFVFADLFEKHLIPVANSGLYEEVLELIAYGSVLLGAMEATRRQKLSPDAAGAAK
ncbi:hypothetical protein [Candidatus Halocynthiibacter alkanivorans]|uniref:hypothetical protein n=1 Tax=Candidatus Halocynthiibacter alkanivorans TaxID=2267619 RepID=UPI000DF1DDF0|nr:hypothetical protein [Candidatus Halocynthiibacter alkanivorans]